MHTGSSTTITILLVLVFVAPFVGVALALWANHRNYMARHPADASDVLGDRRDR